MPGALLIIAWSVDGAVKEAQLRADSLKLAVGVLSDGEATAPLRKFAVDLLAASTPEGIELSDDLRRILESGETVLPRIVSGVGTALGMSKAEGAAAGGGAVAAGRGEAIGGAAAGNAPVEADEPNN